MKQRTVPMYTHLATELVRLVIGKKRKERSRRHPKADFSTPGEGEEGFARWGDVGRALWVEELAWTKIRHTNGLGEFEAAVRLVELQRRVEWQEDVWKERWGQVWEGYRMPCFPVLTKFCKQGKNMGGFWVGCGGLTCSLKIMEPGGSLEDDSKQVVVCDHTYFPILHSAEEAVPVQMTQRGPYQEWNIHCFLLHNWRWHRRWLLFTCPGWLHFRIFTYKNYVLWMILYLKSLCQRIYVSFPVGVPILPTFNPSPSPWPHFPKGKTQTHEGNPSFLSLRIDTWNLLTIQSYLFSIH